MTESKICTCPSGDGSLRWPCPAHPAEQAGGDERAAFKTAYLAEFDCDADGDDNMAHSNTAWRAWKMARAALAHDEQEQAAHEIRLLANALGECIQAAGITAPGVPLTGPQLLMFAEDLKRDLQRAALAQPSPAQAEQHWQKLEKPAQVGAIRFRAGLSSRLVVEAAQRLYEFESTPEQEAERPEVVAYRTIGRHEKHQHPHYALNYYKQNAEDQATHWRERGCEVSEDELMTVAQHERIVGALRAKAAQLREALEWRAENQAGQRELLRSVTAERDAALAEVERLRESKGDPVGSLEKCMKVMYERDENAKRLDAALARVAELEKGTVYVEARQCDECQHVGINDSADGLAACHDCDWTGPEPDEDKCPDCQRENCMAAACPQCGARYVLVASEEIAAPVAQAQHSVPEGWRIERSAERIVVMNMKNGAGYAAARDGESGIAESVLYLLAADLLAAAPGKEVPQAWLDVQAERRRQITAEGWTPDHDDLYCAAELPRAAAAYILSGANDEAPAIWPFSAKWWKPRDARANYMRAGALILAEIERLDRAAAAGKEGV
ncbi:hypothetical protein [Pseudomonas aeruginosa]|uniref:hypothetical protein n=1 Tax=Pseudomonas aeruginosa TaxID=287 RepID=UPI003D033280